MKQNIVMPKADNKTVIFKLLSFLTVDWLDIIVYTLIVEKDF